MQCFRHGSQLSCHRVGTGSIAARPGYLVKGMWTARFKLSAEDCRRGFPVIGPRPVPQWAAGCTGGGCCREHASSVRLSSVTRPRDLLEAPFRCNCHCNERLCGGLQGSGSAMEFRHGHRLLPGAAVDLQRPAIEARQAGRYGRANRARATEVPLPGRGCVRAPNRNSRRRPARRRLPKWQRLRRSRRGQ